MEDELQKLVAVWDSVKHAQTVTAGLFLREGGEWTNVKAEKAYKALQQAREALLMG